MKEACILEEEGILKQGFVNDFLNNEIRNIKEELFTTSLKHPNESQIRFASLMAFQGRFEKVKMLSVVDLDLDMITTEHIRALLPCIEQFVSIQNVKNICEILNNIKCSELLIKKKLINSEERRDLENAMKQNGRLEWIKLDSYSLRFLGYAMNELELKKNITTWASSLGWELTRIRKKSNIYEIMRRRS